MWILYWGGQPSYWLHGDHTYVFGRRSTDIIVEEDPSISRAHASLHVGVGAPPAPAPLTLTDLSKYGTSVSLPAISGTGEDCEEMFVSTAARTGGEKGGATGLTADSHSEENFVAMKKDEEFSVPADVCEFKLHLGTHGTVFRAKWEPTPVVLCDVSEEYRTKIEFGLTRCGMFVVPNAEHAELFLCGPTFSPNPLSAIALCRAKPLVDAVSYLDRIRTRISPKVPLPDVRGTLVLPRASSDWSEMLAGSGGADEKLRDVAELRELFVPRTERRSLLSGLHFVCPQRVLYNEVSAYLAFAQAKVFLDVPPKSKSVPSSGNETSFADHLWAWGVRHCRHVVLLHVDEQIPATRLDPSFQQFLQEQTLVTIEYRALVKAIICVERPEFPAYPRLEDKHLSNKTTPISAGAMSAATSATSPFGGAAVVEQRAPTVSPSPAAVGKGGSPRQVGKKSSRRDTEEVPEGQRDEPGIAPVPVPVALGLGQGAVPVPEQLYEDLVMHGPLQLPPFPCFLKSGSTSSASNHRPFRKQRLLGPSYPLEEMQAVAPAAAVAITARVAAVDAEGVIPSQVFVAATDEPRLADFNTFDHHIEQRKARTASRAKGKKGAASAQPAQPPLPATTGKSLAGAMAGTARDSPQPPPAHAQPPAPSRATGGFNIFDVDNLY